MSDGPDVAQELTPLKRALFALKDLRTKLDVLEQARREPIAIIGLGCRLPGANSAAAFWELLRDGVDAITEVPRERWDIDAYYDSDPEAPGKMYTRRGGFVSGVDQFDPQFFGISPREAIGMDPQQRLLLEVSWEALEHAGLAPDDLVASRTGVFIGISSGDYAQLQPATEDPGQINAHTGTGAAFCVAAGRISYVLGLQGPNVATDTACSSSLVTIHQACQSLRRGESDLALAGGVNLILTPYLNIYFSKVRAMSADGRCKTFDAAADGYVRGEGCGIIVLKRLSDALADGDNILAVIRGTAINHDGRSSGLTVPNGRAQQAVIRAALADAGDLDPHEVSYVEAHGTGTPLGDPIEIRALAATLSRDRSKDEPLVVGSVKTNIGHLEAAAGIAAVIKVVLSLQHKEIPPHLHLRQPNPHIDWENLPIRIPDEGINWQPKNGRYLAGISSFGFSGTNAHIIVEAAPEVEVEEKAMERPLHLLALSARNQEALQNVAAQYAHYLATHEVEMGDVAYTANVGRSRFAHRLAVVGSDAESFRQKLIAFTDGQAVAGMASGHVVASKARIAFLFTGQGAQYAGMGRELYETQPTFRAVLDECDRMLQPYLERPLLTVLYPQNEADAQLIHQTAYTQPALFALEYALAQLWQSWGIKPAAVIGHSVGEYVAACVAGVFSLEDGLGLIAERGRLMQALPAGGAMAAVFANEARVAEAVAPFADQVSIAAINGPDNVVISGAGSAVQTLLDHFRAEGIQTRALTVSHAFHSPLMEPMLAAFEQAAAAVNYHSPQIPLITNLTGQVLRGEAVDKAHWLAHVHQPVRFAEGMQTLSELGYELFLEVGPSPTLLSMGRRCLPSAGGVWLPSLRPGAGNWQPLLESLGQLYLHGVDVNWRGFDQDYSYHKVALPTYPFQRQRYWLAEAEPKPVVGTFRAVPGAQHHPLLGQRLPSALQEIQFETQISAHSPSFMAQRHLHDRILLPETTHLEVGLAVAGELFSTAAALTDVRVVQPLSLASEDPQPVQVIVTPLGTAGATYQVFAHHPAKNDWRLLASGNVEATGNITVPEPVVLEAIQARSQATDVTTYFDQLEQQGLKYGDTLQLISELWLGDGETLACFQLPPGAERYQLHPLLLELCCHLLGNGAVATFASLDRLHVYERPAAPVWCHARFRTTSEDTVTGDMTLFGEAGHPVAELIGLCLRRATAETAALDVNEWLYAVEWQAQPHLLAADLAPANQPGQWLILADQGGVGAALAEALQARGESCLVIRPHLWPQATVSANGVAGQYVDPVDPDAFRVLLAEMAAKQPFRGIVHLWSLDIPDPIEDGLAAFDSAWALGTGSALHLVQALATLATEFKSDPSIEPPRLWLVTRAAQAVAMPNGALLHGVAQAPLWGLAKTIALEHTKLWGGIIDLDPEATAAEAPQLLAEIWQPDGEHEVTFRRAQRYVARLVPARDRFTTPSYRLRPDGAYLISGGLGSLGLQVARWLAEQGARRLILLGRTPLPPRAAWKQVTDVRLLEQIQAIRRLEAQGATVHTAAVDVANEAQLSAFLATYEEEDWPPIRGVVHAAGLIQDKTLLQLDMAALQAVLRPKVNGGWLLHHLLQDAPLDFFVLFSSAASLTGSAGQGNYAAANAFLDALAHYRRQQGQPALSINWGPWAEVGMSARVELEGRGARRGMASIAPRQGVAILGHLLWQEASQVGVLPLSPAQLLKLYPTGRSFLTQLAAEMPAEIVGEAIKQRVDERILAAPVAERLDLIENHLRQRVAQIIMMEPATILAEHSVMELGLDSIMIMELIKELDQDLHLTLYPREIFECPSLTALAEYLLLELGRTHGLPSTTSEAVQVSSAVRDRLLRHSNRSLVQPEKRNPGIIFLLSSPRSGSTLLRVMLAGHPQLFCPPELHLLPFDRMARRAAELEHSYLGEGLQRAVMELTGADAEAGKALVAEWVAQDLTVHEVYGRLQELAGARILVDKSPSYGSDLEILERAEVLFENSKYIHLVRHPYAVIDSFVRNRLDKMLSTGSADPAALAEQVWTTTTGNILDFLEEMDPARHHLVRYEDLVTDPEKVMQALCDFLGVAFVPELLAPYQGNRMTDGVYAQSLSIGDPNFLKHSGIDPALAEAWKQVKLPRRPGSFARRIAAELDYDLPWPLQPSAPMPPTTDDAAAIRPISRDADLPLSFSQQRLLFIDQFEPGMPTYNIPAVVRLSGRLDVTALEHTLGEIIRRHEALRTNFIMVEGRPFQEVAPVTGFALPMVNLEVVPEAQREAEVQRLATEEVRQPFDLAADLKLRARLLRLADREHVLILAMHHIASDGWSVGVFLRELAALYEAFAAGRPSPLPDLPVQYVDYAYWQQEELSGAELEKQLSYWREQLGSHPPVLELPGDRPRPAVQSYNGERYPITFAPELTAALKTLSRQEGVTLFMTLLAAFKTLLYRYTGQADIAVGSPIAGRNRPEIKDLIGFFVNTLVMRTDLSGEPSFRELLKRVRQVALAAYEHQELPFEKVVEELRPQRDLSHSPFFQVMCVLQNAPIPDLKLPDLTLSPIEVNTGTSKFDLSLSLTAMPGPSPTAEGLRGWLEYNTDLFDRTTIARMVSHLEMLLAAVVANPDQKLDDLPLLTESERHQILIEWNSTGRDYVFDRCLHQIFEAQVEQTPDAVAIVFEGEALTYAEFNRRANQLAHYLQSIGVGPEVLVGVALERSLEMVIGLYGILKAGGAYVPLDPTYPPERLAFMVGDTRAPVLLTQAKLLDKVPHQGVHLICLDTDWDLIARHCSENPASEVAVDNLAYVIYTSGSTGKPKGVMNSHRSILNRLLWGQEKYQLTASDRLLQKTPFSFDVSVPEFFWPLMAGACLVVARPEGHKDNDYLAQTIAEQQITTVHFVPSMLQQFLESKELDRSSSLRRVFCSGEALSLDTQKRFFARLNAELHNLYGPTEAAVEVSYWACQRDGQLRFVPIGRPIANTQLYILDQKMRPVPIGVAGELHIGGTNVARGYLNRPELTAAKFIPDPFSDEPGARLYKTGDLARYLPDGNIEFLGRIDFQVKIRGFRIELGEIETVLAEHEAVREVVVVAREDAPGDQRLVAYLVPALDSVPTTSEFHRYLKKHLPEYMVPSTFVVIDAMPLSPNGKISRQALPVPASSRPELASSFVAPRTPIEEELTRIWIALLRVEKIGVHDNFFELGGHSLLATQLIAATRNNLEVEIPLRNLFGAPTIAELATVVEKFKRSLKIPSPERREPVNPESVIQMLGLS